MSKTGLLSLWLVFPCMCVCIFDVYIYIYIFERAGSEAAAIKNSQSTLSIFYCCRSNKKFSIKKKTHRLDARRLEIERLYTAVVVSEAQFEFDQVFFCCIFCCILRRLSVKLNLNLTGLFEFSVFPCVCVCVCVCGCLCLCVGVSLYICIYIQQILSLSLSIYI